ncbi:MAG TPA: VanZ family protein, partial [Candidatus Cloacimonas sp.]|nr:VanZ family protein [Candidatus Cloacimonas sp.]
MIEERNIMKSIKWLFWGWLIVVLVINVVPLGNELNRDLTAKRFIFRLDYVVHSLTFLAFAWIWVFGKIKNVRWYKSYEVLKFCGIVFVSAIGVELLQIIIPYRTFNPMDMMANLFGAILCILFILISHREHRRHRKEIIATENTE